MQPPGVVPMQPPGVVPMQPPGVVPMMTADGSMVMDS